MATIPHGTVDEQTIWYILDDITQYLGNYRNILAVIGIFHLRLKYLSKCSVIICGENIKNYFSNDQNFPPDLMLLGTVLILKKASVFVFDVLGAFQTYFVSRFLVGRNLRKICGGNWAGKEEIEIEGH